MSNALPRTLWSRLRVAWGEFVGPEASATENTLTLGCGLLGLLIAPSLTASASSLPPVESLLLRVLAADLWGGAVANNTRACAQWYERPGQGDAEHLRFAAAHLHPVLVAWLDRRHPGLSRPGRAWAVSHYGYLMLATAVLRRLNGNRRRAAAVVLTLVGALLDLPFGRTGVAPWFATVYYTKLLLGHAGTALWRLQPAPID